MTGKNSDFSPVADILNDSAEEIYNQGEEAEASTTGDFSAGETEEVDGSAVIAKSKLVLIKKLLENIKENGEKLNLILSEFVTSEDEKRIGFSQALEKDFGLDSGRIVEGIFDGENMIGQDGKQYSIPANYASKSKLVEGDTMKLTITDKGTFIFKQIGPIERKRILGELEREADGNFYVSADGRRWRVLTASVTYYKGEAGDEAVILVPKSGESKWAAVENVVKTS